MRVLQVHNFYQQSGGEDGVVAAEHALLRKNGHDVFQYTVHNDSVNELHPLGLGIKTIWNGETYRNVRRVIAENAIEVMHVHNTLPLISPAVYYAAEARQVPVVQTLHNYRLLCPAATFYRDGSICELCLHKTIKAPAVQHRCYKKSRPATAAVTAMLAVHGIAGTYGRKVHTYIALTEFARNKFLDGGLPSERLVIKPNFLAMDPGPGNGSGGYALFAGRLTAEKGMATLLDSWAACPGAIPLKIAGDGPMKSYVAERAALLPNVEYLGAREHAAVLELLRQAAFLVFPSRWYEGMPMVILESMACGTPVIAFALGSLNDLIVDGVNGIKLPLQDAHLLAHAGERVAGLRDSARAHFERHFTAGINYQMLHEIYRQALG